MATNNSSNLNITALDFDTIKANLISYLKGQDQFKDYDFEGAGLSILMDLLAYNTHYQAYYANMIANETFMDSAMLRGSATSIAKHLNYIPKSYKSAVAYVNVELLNPTSTVITNINRGQYFISSGERFAVNTGTRSFVFTAVTDTQVLFQNGKYIATNVRIQEGEVKTETFVYDPNSNVDQKFVISDLSVDTDTLSVRVSASIGDTTGVEDLWTSVTDINLLSSESKAYFLQQNADGFYEIYFGDNIIGKKPQPGNVITIGYKTSSGAAANDIGKNETTSTPSFRYSGATAKTLLVIDELGKPVPTFGGSDPESLQSIKYYAPRNYQAQERAVTADDYRVLIAKQYGDQADSVFVWGGEDNDPPVYGKVFISIKPTNTTRLTSLQKLAIEKNILKTKNVISIMPEIVDPDYLYLLLTVNVKYDPQKTTLTQESLAANIKSLLYSYAQQNIGKFDRDFVRSNFITYINTTFNPPVVSNTFDLTLQKRLEPNLSAITTYAINFDNALYHPIAGYSTILSSTSFGYQDSTSTATVKPTVLAYLDEDGLGNVRIYKLNGGTKIYLNSTAGTIDYSTGKINLVNFAPSYLGSDSSDNIKITVQPELQVDILSRRNQILIVEQAGIDVLTVPQTLRYDPYSASASSFNSTN